MINLATWSESKLSLYIDDVFHPYIFPYYLFIDIYKATHSHCDYNWRRSIIGLYYLCKLNFPYILLMYVIHIFFLIIYLLIPTRNLTVTVITIGIARSYACFICVNSIFQIWIWDSKPARISTWISGTQSSYANH